MAIIDFAQHLAGKGLNKNTIRAYLNYYKLFDQGLENQDLDQSYINRFLIDHSSNATRSFLNNLFEFLGIDHLKVPKLTGARAKRKRRSLSPQEIKVLRTWLNYNKNKRYLLCFDLSYYCALRRAEVLGIKIEDFDLKVWAQNPSQPCKLLIHGKRNKDRYVPVNSKIMKRVIEYINKLDKGMEDRLFAFHWSEWHKAFKDAVKSTMDYNYTLHDLRRSRATRWIQEGKNIINVRNRLGHNSVQTTQLYINLDEEKEYNEWANE